jgi:hypothetical protein
MAVTSLARRVEKVEAIIAPTSQIIVMEAGCDVPEAEVDAFVGDFLHARPLDLVVVIQDFTDPLGAPRHIKTYDGR